MISVPNISLLNKEWEKSPLNTSSIRLTKLSLPTNLCPQNFTINKRIGSDSNYGLVYQITYHNKDLALKILPIIDDISEAQNLKELQIAQQASNLVINKQSESFPIVYGVGKCLNVLYDPTNKFYLPTSTYFKRTTNLEAHILISELESIDLKQFLLLIKDDLTNEFMEQLFLSCVNLIYELQLKLKIIHNDFHLGNILLRFENDNFFLLAHDFGKSKYLSEIIDNNDYFEDLKILTLDLLVFMYNKPNISQFTKKIEQLSDYLEEETDPHKKYTLDYIINTIYPNL